MANLQESTICLGTLSESLASILTKYELEPYEEYERRRREGYNRSEGNLHLIDGYDCPSCKNRGDFEIEDGQFKYCACKPIRDNIRRIKKSGLLKIMGACTFEKYEVKEPWQQRIKDTAREYCNMLNVSWNSWFFIGGAIGSGKTHICTAIAGEIMLHEPLLYVLWPDESVRLKGSISGDSEEYESRMAELKNIQALYIDDLFKIPRQQLPSAADVRLAHELINYRYANHKRTIISSERTLIEITDIDQAIGGRIKERAKGYTLAIARDISRDYRLRDQEGAKQ